MYRVNDFQRSVLITEDEVIFHAPTKQTLDPRMVRQSIIIAEERFVRPALGYTFYQAVLAAKNVTVAAGNKAALETASGVTLTVGQVINSYEQMSAFYQSLWLQILWKYAAECVMLICTAEAYVQFGSEGVVHVVPPAGPMTNSGIVSPELRTVKWIMDKKMMDRIDPLQEALHLYLCNNIANYPLYKKDCNCDEDGVASKRKTDIILGLYDEADGITYNKDCCE